MRAWFWMVMAACAAGAMVPAWAQSTTTPGLVEPWSWRDILTAAGAAIGTLLGIYNAVVARETRKVKLRVVPGWNYAPGYTAFSIEVVNLSSFTVTVDQVGFLERGSKRTLPVISPILTDGGEWPRKLAAQESVNIHFDVNTIPTGIWLGKAFAQTASDERRTGSSRALDQLARLVKKGSLTVPPHPGRLPRASIRSVNPLPPEEVGGP